MIRSGAILLSSESVNPQIDALLLSGRAATAHEAESIFLDEHLDEITRLVVELDDESFEKHEAVKLLMSHGSRRLEDAVKVIVGDPVPRRRELTTDGHR